MLRDRGLSQRLEELTYRHVTLLDGDSFRAEMGGQLGFGEAARELNVQRLAYVSRLVTATGGIVITAAIAPYANVRLRAREVISKVGGFVEVYVSTPLEICEARDPKQLYKKAREGIIPNFTGISDPYEAPQSPEIALDMSTCSVWEAVDRVVEYLRKEKYL